MQLGSRASAESTAERQPAAPDCKRCSYTMQLPATVHSNIRSGAGMLARRHALDGILHCCLNPYCVAPLKHAHALSNCFADTHHMLLDYDAC